MWLIWGTVGSGWLKKWVLETMISPERRVEAKLRGRGFILGVQGSCRGL